MASEKKTIEELEEILNSGCPHLDSCPAGKPPVEILPNGEVRCGENQPSPFVEFQKLFDEHLEEAGLASALAHCDTFALSVGILTLTAEDATKLEESTT